MAGVIVVTQAVGGETHVPWRQYDLEHDVFVDVDASSLGIEEE